LAGLINTIEPNDLIPNPTDGPNLVTPKVLFDKLANINDPEDEDFKSINTVLKGVYGDLMDNSDFVRSLEEGKGVLIFAIDNQVVNVVNPEIPSTQKTASATVGHEIGAHGQNIVDGVKLDDNKAINTDKEHANFKESDKTLNDELNKSIQKSERGD